MLAERTCDYKACIRECFETDPELIEKWHIEAGSDLDRCVDRTYNDLKDNNVDVFLLKKSDKLVGYFGIEKKMFLTGFFLKPEYRTKDNVTEFWKIVDSQFEGNYMAGVYEKNQRAVKFLSRRSVYEFRLREMNGLVFVMKKEH